MLALPRVGDVYRISIQLDLQEPASISGTVAYLYTSAGTVLTGTNGAAGGQTGHEGDVSKRWDLYYDWATTGLSADDYTGKLVYTVGTETRSEWFEQTLLPVTSKYDRWVQTIGAVLQQERVGEALERLGYRDLMRAASMAVEEYSRFNPRVLQYSKTLTAGVWVYNLTDLTSWVNGFSELRPPIYPYDSTLQSRPALGPLDYVVDEAAGTYRFLYATPSAGEIALLDYTAPHTLSHTVDTLPAAHYYALTRYAAGLALEMLASGATASGKPGGGVDVVVSRTPAQDFSALARALKERAVGSWRPRSYSL
jgi:hypothetical protein